MGLFAIERPRDPPSVPGRDRCPLRPRDRVLRGRPDGGPARLGRGLGRDRRRDGSAAAGSAARARRRPPRARADRGDQPRLPRPADLAARRGRDRRRPQLLHAQSRARADRRDRIRSGDAAPALPRRPLAARAARHLLRPGANPRGATVRRSAENVGLAPDNPGVTEEGLPFAVRGAQRGRPAKRHDDRDRGLHGRSARPAPRRRSRLLRIRGGLARGGAVERRRRGRRSRPSIAIPSSSASRPTASSISSASRPG